VTQRNAWQADDAIRLIFHVKVLKDTEADAVSGAKQKAMGVDRHSYRR
jgi:hypothetical protein